MHEKISFGGWPNCIRLTNGSVDLVATTDVGPRILRFGFTNEQNFFHLIPGHAGKTGGDIYRMYGGHRFWIAPENIPLSYYPDNFPVDYSLHANTLKLSQKESTTKIVKQLEITLDDGENEARILHRFINEGTAPIELAPWGLSLMAAGSRGIVPQEPYGEGDDFLLPARSMALWQYTIMNDPRWIWGDRYIQAKHDPGYTSEQKIGVLNKQQWVACYLNKQVLIKKFPYDPTATYPDFNSNNEVYINGNFLEIETLGPLCRLGPGAIIEHPEHWLLARAESDETEASITKNILPIAEKFIRQG
jgi:hypothetical protein